ncbi:uncharacterized protein CEXT_70321 [Caerostris extrusa]|uniref:Uncharacterized protein n=1 Tax=Caerostris extrusa TaxID=172846 RepID=A0AAV4XCD6_CAEEX|nr:uncharacterized protein CEXT_70321 [Caerostris extrusa]
MLKTENQYRPRVNMSLMQNRNHRDQSPPNRPKVAQKEVSPESKKSPVALKGRLPDTSSELPLLKKVLLRKVMDDKKAEESQVENQIEQGASSDEQFVTNEDFRNENGEASQETVSNRVYLEQFSRTLGFKMSEEVAPTPKPQPRPRLNASSLTPSPSSENVVSAASSEQKQEESEVEETKTVKSTSPPKGRLSRMMAVREDSDENSVMAEDPFVKSTECQTEITGSNLEHLNATETNKNDSESDIALRSYLTKMIIDLETVIKAYSLEQQQDLLKENAILKQNQDNKDTVIKKLLSRMEETQPWETFDEVSSLGASSISVSEIKDEICSNRKESETEAPPSEEDEDRDLEDEEILALQDKLRLQRKSWPTSDPDVSDQTELWRLEFPPPPPDMEEAPWVGVAKPIYPVVAEGLIEVVHPPEEEKREHAADATRSGEALTWDKVLHMRNSVRTKNSASESGDTRSGRKYSLIEESSTRSIGAMHQWAAVGVPSNVPQSTSYTSLMNPENRQDMLISETRGKVDPMNISQKNFGVLSIQAPPRGRKSSLPILPSPSTVCKARWLSMEDVKNNKQEYNHQSSISSSCSQETVVEMEIKPSFVETTSRLSDWPSSPCLPTIREDDQISCPLNTPLKSSPGRSVSHDLLTKRVSLPTGKQNYRTVSCPQGNPDSFHSLETVRDTTSQEVVKRDSVVLNLDLRSHHYQEVAQENQYYSNIRATNNSSRPALSSTAPLKR